jgi:hypothetical protein
MPKPWARSHNQAALNPQTWAVVQSGATRQSHCWEAHSKRFCPCCRCLPLPGWLQLQAAPLMSTTVCRTL